MNIFKKLLVASVATIFSLSALARQRSSSRGLKFEGPSAPYFLAIDNGHFSKAGLEVEISPGKGSLDAIPKVATGAFPVGSLILTR